MLLGACDHKSLHLSSRPDDPDVLQRIFAMHNQRSAPRPETQMAALDYLSVCRRPRAPQLPTCLEHRVTVGA